MAFTSFTYLYFLAIVVALYWIVRNRIAQNVLLVVGSYVFYGWLTPWYCALLATSTLVTYGCLHFLWRTPEGHTKSRWPVAIAIGANIGMLAILKYWNFWLDDIVAAAEEVGWQPSKGSLSIALPLGLSFYTLQAVGLVIDAYRGDVKRQSFLNVSFFLAFFPKLIAGPFEKASGFFLQADTKRSDLLANLGHAMPILLLGFVKKLVVAENIGLYVDQAYMINEPSLIVLVAATVGFAVQILADFSGYTDIARGSAKLFGFELMENFNYPYLAVSPSDFWRRWHISLSHWFRDYVYIPLGGSRVQYAIHLLLVLLVTMGLSGIWHGATINFAFWGLYYGCLIFLYDKLGLGGHWRPQSMFSHLCAWSVMCWWTILGWMLFKTSSLTWLWNALKNFQFGITSQEQQLTALVLLGVTAVFTVPWIVATIGESYAKKYSVVSAMCRALSLISILILGSQTPSDFIYFNF